MCVTAQVSERWPLHPPKARRSTSQGARCAQLCSQTPCGLACVTDPSAPQAALLGKRDVSFLNAAGAQVAMGPGQGSALGGHLHCVSQCPPSPLFHRREEEGSKEDVPQVGLGHVIPMCQSSGSKVTVSLLVYTGVAEDTDVTCRPPLAAL